MSGNLIGFGEIRNLVFQKRTFSGALISTDIWGVTVHFSPSSYIIYPYAFYEWHRGSHLLECWKLDLTTFSLEMVRDQRLLLFPYWKNDNPSVFQREVTLTPRYLYSFPVKVVEYFPTFSKNLFDFLFQPIISYAIFDTSTMKVSIEREVYIQDRKRSWKNWGKWSVFYGLLKNYCNSFTFVKELQ